jgi:hypothetical protein
MDWLKQTEEMVKNWMDAQQKIWHSWSENLPNPATTSWDKTVAAWENSFKNFVESQSLWSRMWMRGMMEKSPVEGTGDMMKVMEEMTRTWEETQLKVWGAWFELVQKFNPEDMSENLKTDLESAMTTWQENLKKVLDTQNEWLAQWAKMMQDKK